MYFLNVAPALADVGASASGKQIAADREIRHYGPDCERPADPAAERFIHLFGWRG